VSKLIVFTRTDKGPRIRCLPTKEVETLLGEGKIRPWKSKVFEDVPGEAEYMTKVMTPARQTRKRK
jgi:hypothetical protein